MNVDKEMQKQARGNLCGSDLSIARYVQVLEHESCHLEKLNAKLNLNLKGLQQQQAG